MTQTERRLYLIQYLLKESSQYADVEIPTDEVSQRQFVLRFRQATNFWLFKMHIYRKLTKLAELRNYLIYRQ